MRPYGTRSEAFRRLREAEPANNLKVRWAFLQQYRAKIAAELAYMELVLAKGWAIGGTADVACSIGLFYRYAHPELVLHCPGLETAAETNSLRAATNALARRIAEGERLDVGDRVTLEGPRMQLEATLEAPDAQHLSVYPCLEVLRFERLFGDREHDASKPPVLWASAIRG